jgi:hypothetical protein
MRWVASGDSSSWARARQAQASASATFGSSDMCSRTGRSRSTDQHVDWLGVGAGPVPSHAGASVSRSTSRRARTSCRVAPVCPVKAATEWVSSIAAFSRASASPWSAV